MTCRWQLHGNFKEISYFKYSNSLPYSFNHFSHRISRRQGQQDRQSVRSTDLDLQLHRVTWSSGRHRLVLRGKFGEQSWSTLEGKDYDHEEDTGEESVLAAEWPRHQPDGDGRPGALHLSQHHVHGPHLRHAHHKRRGHDPQQWVSFTLRSDEQKLVRGNYIPW